MSYIVKLCYLPLLTDPTFLFTQPLSISSELVENGIKANNISFINDELMVTVDDTLDGTVNSNLFKSNYNCLLLYNDNVDYIEVYKVTSINFISGKQVRVKARLTNYSIDKKEVIDNNTTYLLTNRTELRSKCGFVKYGYAYDSVLKPDGTLNLDGVGGTDIYKPVEFRNINLLKYRKKIGFRVASNINTREFDDVKSKALDDCISCWLYVYCEPREYALKKYIPSDTEGYDGTYEDVNFKVNNLIMRNYSSTNSVGTVITLPYGVIAIPITKESDKPLNLRAGGGYQEYTVFRINEFFERYASYIYNIKLSARPIGEIHSGSIEINDYTVAITTSVIVGPTAEQNTVGTLDGFGYNYRIRYGNGGGTDNFIAIDSCNSDALELLPVNYSELYPFYPRGFDGKIVSKQEFENYNYNPYIKGHATKIRITDGMGGIKEYTPFELGLFDELVFYYYEALTPDITKIYITPKVDKLSYSLLKENIDKTYNGVVNDVDLTLPYSQDQLQAFLSNNKNYFQQRMVNAWLHLQTQSEQSANWFIASYFNKSDMGMASAINKQSQALYDFALNIYNTNITKENLKSAPDELNNVKSNYVWLLSIQEELKPAIEIYTADEYTIKSAYQRFCEFGIKLDKYVDEIELRKYLNFNTVYPHDKSEYKYINCDVKLYGYYTWFLRQQDILERELADGIYLVNKQAEIKDVPQADYDVIQSLKEEDFNFE